MYNTEKSRGQRSEVRGQRIVASRRSVVCCLLLTAYCLLAFGCRQDMQDQPRYEAYEASDGKFFDDQQSARPLIEGTVARGHLRDNDLLYTGQPGVGPGRGAAASATGNVPPGGNANVTTSFAEGVSMQAAAGQPGGVAGAGANAGPDIFPFPITESDLRRGQERFNVFCSMCHGMTGEGDGMLVRRGFRQPPSFHSEQLQPGNASSAHFFDVMTNGWGAMPKYSAQIPAEDRWRIIAYVRALQLSQRGTVADVPADKRGQFNTGAQPPSSSEQPHGGEQR